MSMHEIVSFVGSYGLRDSEHNVIDSMTNVSSATTCPPPPRLIGRCMPKFRDPEVEKAYQEKRSLKLIMQGNTVVFALSAFMCVSIPVFAFSFDRKDRWVHITVSLSVSILCGMHGSLLPHWRLAMTWLHDVFMFLVGLSCQILAGLIQDRLAHLLAKKQDDFEVDNWLDVLNVLAVCSALSAGGFVAQRRIYAVFLVIPFSITANFFCFILELREDIKSEVLSFALASAEIVVVGLAFGVVVRRRHIRERKAFQEEYANLVLKRIAAGNRRARSMIRKDQEDAERANEELINANPRARPFRRGDLVRVIKEARTKGKTAVVTQPNWNGLVKVEMDEPDPKGRTKSYKAEDLEYIEQPKSQELHKGDSVRVVKCTENVGKVGVVVEPSGGSVKISLMDKTINYQADELEVVNSMQLCVAPTSAYRPSELYAPLPHELLHQEDLLPRNVATSSKEPCPNAILANAVRDRQADWVRIRHMAQSIRDDNYNLRAFFEDCIASFPELQLFFLTVSNDESNGTCASGRSAEVEYQRTIGALFAVYWLLRIELDGCRGFTLGVDSSWATRPVPEVTSKKPVSETEATAGQTWHMKTTLKTAFASGAERLHPQPAHTKEFSAHGTSHSTGQAESVFKDKGSRNITSPIMHGAEALGQALSPENYLATGSRRFAGKGSVRTNASRKEASNRLNRTSKIMSTGMTPMMMFGRPWSHLNEDEKRWSFHCCTDWTLFSNLAEQAGCGAPCFNGDSEDIIDRIMALLCLTAFHDIMKIEALLPVVLPAHAPYLGYAAGIQIRDHDIALSYIMKHFPYMLPSYVGLPEKQRQALLFTQGKMQFNHGWFVQAEAPPGAMLSKFKQELKRGASASDVSLYFMHWLTDLAGAEGTPLGGAEKFVLKFPHAVLLSFLWSIPYLENLATTGECDVVESYLQARWRCIAPDKAVPHDSNSIAAMRLAVMAQGDYSVVRAFYDLHEEDRGLLSREFCRSGIDHQQFRDSAVAHGGPAFLVYYAPALLQRNAGKYEDLRQSLRVLCQVLRGARHLWPFRDDAQGNTVTVTIAELKSTDIRHIVGTAQGSHVRPSGGESAQPHKVWVLIKHNDCEASVEVKTPAQLNVLLRTATPEQGCHFLDFSLGCELEKLPIERSRTDESVAVASWSHVAVEATKSPVAVEAGKLAALNTDSSLLRDWSSPANVGCVAGHLSAESTEMSL